MINKQSLKKTLGTIGTIEFFILSAVIAIKNINSIEITENILHSLIVMICLLFGLKLGTGILSKLTKKETKDEK